jgi:hypothetical protein
MNPDIPDIVLCNFLPAKGNNLVEKRSVSRMLPSAALTI